MDYRLRVEIRDVWICTLDDVHILYINTQAQQAGLHGLLIDTCKLLCQVHIINTIKALIFTSQLKFKTEKH